MDSFRSTGSVGMRVRRAVKAVLTLWVRSRSRALAACLCFTITIGPGFRGSLRRASVPSQQPNDWSDVSLSLRFSSSSERMLRSG